MKPTTKRSLALGLLLVTGCYRYVPQPADGLAPGTAVRARVTAPEAERLAGVLGRNTRVVHGEVVEQTSDALLLQVLSTGSSTSSALYQRVTLLPASVQELEVRELDPWKTAGVAGVAVAAVAAAILQLSAESKSSRGEGSTPEAVRIPAGVVR